MESNGCSAPMNTDQKSRIIIQRLLEICNKHAMLDPTAPVIQIGPDWGGNALTFYIGEDHLHFGMQGGTFEQMIDSMYNVLSSTGASWMEPKIH